MELFESSLTDPWLDIPTGHYSAESMKSTVVPNRNAIFAAITYGYALSIAKRSSAAVSVCLGVHSGDHAIYPDCRPEFYECLFDAFNIGNWDSELVTLELPYLYGDKATILKDALGSCFALGLDFDTVMSNTNTSYQPDNEGRAHGKTGADIERILAFHKIGRKDPIEYVEPWNVVLEHAIKTEQEHAKK